MKNSILSVVLLFVAVFTAQAQNVTVHGTVQSKLDGEPLIGASVISDATKKGTATDIDGRFTMIVPQGSTLTVSYVGYLPVKVKAAQNLTVSLDEDHALLDEVVVMGYQTVRYACASRQRGCASCHSLCARPHHLRRHDARDGWSGMLPTDKRGDIHLTHPRAYAHSLLHG